MSADTEIVRARLRSLLPTVDMETATQRSITQRLEEELGVPLSAHKPLIKVPHATRPLEPAWQLAACRLRPHQL